MSEKYDVIAVGMGPSSIFMAYELIKLNKAHKVLLIEQGKKVEDRNCPIEKLGKCIHCKPMCNITCGFSGAGAFSDGKLSLYNEEDDDIYIGGVLHKYVGVEETKIDSIGFSLTVTVKYAFFPLQVTSIIFSPIVES